MKKVFVTGGHFAPAKAVIQELLRRGNWQIYYLGRKYSMEGETSLALEFTEIQTLPQVKYLTIITGRLQRQFFVNIGQSVFAFLKIFIGLAQSLFWLLRYQPDVVLSFGGYVAVPVAFWAWCLGIPILTHEQTTVSGRANKLLALFARKIMASWPQSLAQFPKKNVVLTGNPIRREVLTQPRTRSSRPTIYITGGSQGAAAIDEAVEKILPPLAKKYQVVSGRLSGGESAKALARADLVVSRAGANTICEILFFGIPAILIPLPHSVGFEQEENARLVENTGLGEILSQRKLTSATLSSLIAKMMANRQKYLVNAPKARKLLVLDAAAKVADELEKEVS